MLMYILCRYNFIIQWVTCLNVRQSPLYTRQNKHLVFDKKIPNLNIHLSQCNVKFWPVDICLHCQKPRLAFNWPNKPVWTQNIGIEIIFETGQKYTTVPPTWIINDIIIARTGSCCSFTLPNSSVVSRSACNACCCYHIAWWWEPCLLYNPIC